MPMLLQICAVIVTMAMVAIAIATVRAMIHFEKTASEFTKTSKALHDSIAEAQVVIQDVRSMVTSLQSVVPGIRGVVTRFEDLGQRAARLSSSVLDEVEAPVRTATAVARGIRTGTSFLLDRIVQRFGRPSTQALSNGGYDHE